MWFVILECKSDEASPGCNPFVCLSCIRYVVLIFVEAGFDPPAKLASWCSLRLGVPSPSHGVGFDAMSRSHCTHPTGGLHVRLKHKKNSGGV